MSAATRRAAAAQLAWLCMTCVTCMTCMTCMTCVGPLLGSAHAQDAPAARAPSARATRAPARAEDAAPEPTWLLGLGVGPLAILGDACRGEGDVFGCQGGVVLLAIDLSLDRQVDGWLQLGGRARFGFEPGSGRGSASSSSTFGSIVQSTEEHRQLWSFGLQARAQARPNSGGWAAVELAAVMLADLEARFDGNARPTGESTVRHWGFAPGLGVGYDIDLSEVVSLGVSARASWVIFERHDNSSHWEYGPGLSLWLGPELRFGL